ncbi:MAG: response regulator transcription factor [Verrucomicrobiota bacterium]
MKILVAEDEAKIADFVVKGLESNGFTVDVFSDGEDAYVAAKTTQYDALVLDIMIPGKDGLEILKSLRAANHPTPIILVTARGALEDRIEGLNLGADDYLPKPFYVDELIARIHAVARRNSGQTQPVLKLGNVSLNIQDRTVIHHGEEILLTAREFNLLAYLMRSPGRVFTRVQILEHVWNYDFDPNTNIVDVYIRRVRNKIREDDGGSIIESVRGVGYKTINEQDS